MKKETFLKLKVKEIKCRNCERILPIDNFTYNLMHEDNTGVCRSCQWIKKHKDKIDYLSNKYSLQMVIDVIHYIYEWKNADLYSFSIENKYDLDIIIDIATSLNIGNKKLSIKIPCEYCGKPAEYTPSAYIKTTHHYCSQECYFKDKSRISPHGKDSIYYNRVETFCTNCGGKIEVTPFDYNKKNRFGDNHNFCSQECYWEYRGKYYVGEKSNSGLIDWTPELINKMRENKAKSMSGENRLNTKPQLIVNSFLDELNIKYTREYCVKYYSIDNYLDEYKLMIEVMGDYWHSNPLRYNSEKYELNDYQLNGIHRDKLKYSYIKNHCNIEILYLWETDIIKHPDICKTLINTYVNNSGILEDYNSFNYSISENNSLILNSNLIIPYKDQSIDKYKCLRKTS